MEEIIIIEVGSAVRMASERYVDTKLLLSEVGALLSDGVKKTYTKMANIDQRLKGKGYLEKIPFRSTEKELKNMRRFIEVRIDSELDMLVPKSSFEAWLKRNKFRNQFIVVLVSVIMRLVGLYAKFKF